MKNSRLQITPEKAALHLQLRQHFDTWLAANTSQLNSVINFGPTAPTPLDLHIQNPLLKNPQRFLEIEAFQSLIDQMMAGAKFGIGGYGEQRPFYQAPEYQIPGPNGPRWRSVHLGIDVWGAADTSVYTPLAAKVHSVQDNQGAGNYGPTIILEHQVNEELRFFTLYGHLSHASLQRVEPGQTLAPGVAFATFGTAEVNGNWPPHLHFQVMLDMMGQWGDFPGVAFPDEWEQWQLVCPTGKQFLFW